MTREEEIKDAMQRAFWELDFPADNAGVAFETGFKAGAEWANKTMIDKAVNWLESVNLDYYQIREGVFAKELVTDFRRAMEE